MILLEFMLQFILEILFYGLISFPGAVIRWLFSSKKRSIRQMYRDDLFSNAAVGILFLIVCICGLLIIIL
jgi:hypothetical protein